MLWFGKKKDNSKQDEVEGAEENKLDLPELPELYPDSSLPEFEETSKFMEHEPEVEPEMEVPEVATKKEGMKSQMEQEMKKIVTETKVGPAQRHEDLEQVFSNITQDPTKQKTNTQETKPEKGDLDSIDFSKLTPKSPMQSMKKNSVKNLKEINDHIKANQKKKHNKKHSHFTPTKSVRDENFMQGTTLFVGNKNYIKVTETLNQLAKLEELDNLTLIKKRETELESKFKRELEAIYNKFLEIEQTIFGGDRK